MLKVAESLQIPVITTEQYPKGLGRTDPLLQVPGPVFEKTQFSMLTPQVRAVLNPKHSIVLFGMETHVCVYQTVKDLLDANFSVFLAADGISSRFPEDKKYALEQMRQWNVTVSTSESIIFELLKDSQHPQFKAMSALIKDRKE